MLIDGQHSFPWPFIDWFYTAERLKIGGVVIVDDTHLMTGKVLKDFLEGEVRAGLWELAANFSKAAAFRKIQAEVNHGIWENQPWNVVIPQSDDESHNGWIVQIAKKTVSRSEMMKRILRPVYQKLRKL